MRRWRNGFGIAFFTLALGVAAQGRTTDRAALQDLDREAERAPKGLSARSELLSQECEGERRSNVECADALVHGQLDRVLGAEERVRIEAPACAAQGSCLETGAAAQEQAAAAASGVAGQANASDAELANAEKGIENAIQRIEDDRRAVLERCSEAAQLEQAVCSL